MPRVTSAVGQRFREEIRHYLFIAAYLFVCFGAIQLFKSAVLREAGVSYMPLGFAAAKALVLAKFLMLGEAAGVGTRLRARSMLQRIVHRGLLLTLLLVLLTIVEELVMGVVHGRSAAQTLAESAGRLPEALATSLLLLLVLVPWVAAQELDRALGRGSLKRMLFATQKPSADPVDRESGTL